MSDDFSAEPVIGHHINAEIYESDSKLSRQLDELADHLDISRRNRERIRIEVGDVDWGETKEVTMRVDLFEAIIEWYENE